MTSIHLTPEEKERIYSNNRQDWGANPYARRYNNGGNNEDDDDGEGGGGGGLGDPAHLILRRSLGADAAADGTGGYDSPERRREPARRRGGGKVKNDSFENVLSRFWRRVVGGSPSSSSSSPSPSSSSSSSSFEGDAWVAHHGRGNDDNAVAGDFADDDLLFHERMLNEQCGYFEDTAGGDTHTHTHAHTHTHVHRGRLDRERNTMPAPKRNNQTTNYDGPGAANEYYYPLPNHLKYLYNNSRTHLSTLLLTESKSAFFAVKVPGPYRHRRQSLKETKRSERSSSSPKSSSRLPVEYLCTAILKVGETEEEAVEVKRWETWWRFSELRAWGMEAQEHIRAGTVFPPDAAGRDVMTGHKNKNKELRFPSRSPLRSFFRGNESDQEKFILRRRRKLNDFVGAVWGGGVWAEGVEAFFGVDNSSFRRRTF